MLRIGLFEIKLLVSHYEGAHKSDSKKSRDANDVTSMDVVDVAFPTSMGQIHGLHTRTVGKIQNGIVYDTQAQTVEHRVNACLFILIKIWQRESLPS